MHGSMDSTCGDVPRRASSDTVMRLAGLAKAGYLLNTTLLWCEGRDKWQPVSEITELAAAASAAK